MLMLLSATLYIENGELRNEMAWCKSVINQTPKFNIILI